MRALQHLHFREHRAEMLRMSPSAPAALHELYVRNLQCRALEHWHNLRLPRRLQLCGIRSKARSNCDRLRLLRQEQLAGVAPECIEGSLSAIVTFSCTIAELHDPLAAMPHVIA